MRPRTATCLLALAVLCVCLRHDPFGPTADTASPTSPAFPWSAASPGAPATPGAASGLIAPPAPPESAAADLPDRALDALAWGAEWGRDAALVALRPVDVVDDVLERAPAYLRGLFATELLSLNGATQPSAARFLAAYAGYTQAVGRALTAAGEAAAGPAGYGAHTRLRRRVAARFDARYRAAMSAADAHLAEFAERLNVRARAEPTYLLVSKSDFLVYLVGERRNDVLAAFPVGVGAVRGPKSRRGDLRTPECPPARATRTATPFFVGPLIRGDVVPNGGVIARGIGVDSRDAGFGFLEGGWLIMLHGTPDAGSMGTRSSLGCIRMLPRHIEVLFEYVKAGARVVITP